MIQNQLPILAVCQIDNFLCMYTCTCRLFISLFILLIYLSIYLFFIYVCIYLFVCLFMCLFIYLLIYSFVDFLSIYFYFFTVLFIISLLIRYVIHMCIYIYTYIYSIIHTYTCVYSCIILYIWCVYIYRAGLGRPCSVAPCSLWVTLAISIFDKGRHELCGKYGFGLWSSVAGNSSIHWIYFDAFPIYTCQMSSGTFQPCLIT